ncbi:MAG: hypothetical protein V1685_04860 [Parcubacteria group bacterium]
MSKASWKEAVRKAGGFLLFFVVGCLVLGQLLIMWGGVADYLPTFRLWLMVQPTIWALALVLLTVFCTSFFREMASEYQGPSRWRRRATWFWGHVVSRLAFLSLAAVFLYPFSLVSGEFNSYDVIYPKGRPELAQELCGSTWYRPDRDVVDRYSTTVPVWYDDFTVWCSERPSAAVRTSALGLHASYGSPANYRCAVVSMVSTFIDRVRRETPGLGSAELAELLEERLPAAFPDKRFNIKLWPRPCVSAA